MRLASAALIASLVATAAAACYVGPIEKDETPKTDQEDTEPEPETTKEKTKEETTKATGLPCEIDELFEKRCRSCHGADAKKAPMALVTYDDLVAESPSDDSKTNAELSLERMKSEDDPMPPGKATKSTSAERKALAKWIADDYPRGSCGAKDDEKEDTGTTKKPDASKKTDAGSKTNPDAGTTTTDAGSTSTSVCTSGKTWAGGTGTQMNPGMSCFGCHDDKFQVGGTIYRTAHEPNKCYGESKISVVLTDANGKKQTLTTNDSGNFTMRANTATQLVPPFHVKVVQDGKERQMVGTAPNGDCNVCHTEAGKNGAPGRIMAP